MRHQIAGLVIALSSLAVWLDSHAVGTIAGTAISNQAEMSFELGGEPQTMSSNTTQLQVAEVLDVNVFAPTPERLVGAGTQAQALLFTLTNTGNGSEQFDIWAVALLPGDQFDPVFGSPSIYFDSDASGDFSAADVPYEAGTNDPVLAADESVDLLVVAAIPAEQVDGDLGLVELRAAAATGTGVPGQSFAGAGDAGVDAVVGASGAAGGSPAQYLVGEVSLVLQKSASISDPAGGSQVVAGAEITYLVTIAADGRGLARDARFSDPIPANTSYLSGSLRLNGLPLSDASDADAGSFAAGEVAIALGDLAAGAPAQQIQFTVTID